MGAENCPSGNRDDGPFLERRQAPDPKDAELARLRGALLSAEARLREVEGLLREARKSLDPCPVPRLCAKSHDGPCLALRIDAALGGR